jgi:23S rRNA pseudouridine1911/1915/1917 synthase
VDDRLHRIEVAPGENRRLDVFLASQASLGLSRMAVQRLCAGGRVHLDGRPARASARLRGGESVVVEVPPPDPAEPLPEAIPLRIVHEDPHIIVVDKPRGMVVHPAPGSRSGTLVNALLAHCGDLAGIGGTLRPGIVHRLDKDTTGLLVAAKTDAAALGLSRQIARREVERTYLAIVHGSPPDDFTVDAPLGRDPNDRKRMAVRSATGRHAVTHARVLERLPGHALLEVRLETGRTHQIRVHLAFAGFPVAADPTYGRSPRGELGLGGQALHAARLAFRHPIDGRPLRFETPPPADFQQALETLRRTARAPRQE